MNRLISGVESEVANVFYCNKKKKMKSKFTIGNGHTRNRHTISLAHDDRDDL